MEQCRAMSTLSCWIRSLVRPFLATSAFGLSIAGSLGCEPPPPVKQPAASAIDPAEKARIDSGRKLIDDANTAIAELKFDKARELLHKAQKLGVESQRFEIEETLDKVDKRHAKLWANEVADRFKSKDCQGALKDLAEPIATFDSEAFIREIRRLSGPEAAKCLAAQADDKILAGELAAARKAIDLADARNILGTAAYKKLSDEVEATILEALRANLKEELEQKRWADAMAIIDEMVKSEAATSEQQRILMAAVRKGITPEIQALAQKGVGHRDGAKILKELDELTKLVRWEILPPDMAELKKDKALPPELAKDRELLGLWVEAQRLKLKPAKKPEKRWAHGKIAIGPGSKVDDPSSREVAHGSELWIIGTTKDYALVASEDPSEQQMNGRLAMAIGWAPLSQLVKENPTDWILPNDQLVGQRVWGPLHKDSPMFELGIVSAVSGKEITVKRLADDVEVKVTRNQLRNGKLSPGTKVLTDCTSKDQPANIVDTPVGKVAKLKCEGGDDKQEPLASLRTKPEFLPASK